MKTVQPLLALVLLAATATSIPAALRVDNAPQYSLSLEVPEDFDWNLQEIRLVQFSPDTEPVLMTELEKVTPISMSSGTSLIKSRSKPRLRD
jgi:hypothetical protein